MSVSRRSFLGGVAAAGAASMTARKIALAQEGTPVAVEGGTPAPVQGGAPGYASARVRVTSTPELNQAIFPHVMRRLLPAYETLAGYRGYIFAFDAADPAAALVMTLSADEAGMAETDAATQEFVDELDPRFTPETPLSEEGPVRIWEFTTRPASELPPFLHGCAITFRNRETAPGADIESVVTMASEELVPILTAMEGFVLYAWILTDTGRLAINVWETMEQLEAGNQAVADYVAENTVETTVGDPVVHSGAIGYAEILGTS